MIRAIWRWLFHRRKPVTPEGDVVERAINRLNEMRKRVGLQQN